MKEFVTPYQDINNCKEELNKNGSTNVISHDLRAPQKLSRKAK